MQTEKDARELGEAVRRALLQTWINYRIHVKPDDVEERRKAEAQQIEEAIAHVQADIRPQYGENFLLKEGVRKHRDFSQELDRLWKRVLEFYAEARGDLHPELAFLHAPENSSYRLRLRSDLRRYAEDLVVPVLEKFPNAGEDLYLLVYHWILDFDPDASVESIAQTGATAAQWMPALYGMLGLLISAKAAHADGEISLAYSYLMDANHLIGLHEGSKYALKYSQEIERKLSARNSNKLSRAATDAVKLRAVDLYHSLRPLDAQGKAISWKSGSSAARAVYAALEAEAYERQKRDPNIDDSPGIAFDTIRDLFAQMVKLEKRGGSLDIKVEVVEAPPQDT